MIGSDDVLACFIAGNAFTWDDWFRLGTLDDSLPLPLICYSTYPILCGTVLFALGRASRTIL
jgi:hypothetical protein